MALDVRVVPWFNADEWKTVKEYLSNGHLSMARNHILLWKSRTQKLHGGIETTLWLLDAVLMQEDEGAHSLALSAAVNRFLNLVTHAGMQMFNMSKYYEVGEQLSIPRWIVDARHDASHGYMPNYDVLKSAAAFSVKWLMVNYWNFEARNHSLNNIKDIESYQNYENIHQLLDTYKYLRIYAIWGNKSIDEIKDQEEIYQQLCDFLTTLKRSQGEPKKKKKKVSVNETVSISDNVVILRNQIEKVIKQGHYLDQESILTTLVQDQLLIPDQDLCKSLVENEGKDDPELPKDLVKVWSDVLSMISQAGLLPDLLTKLVALKQTRTQAEAWTSKILREVLKTESKKKELKLNVEDSDWDEFIENYILTCDPGLKNNLDILSQLPNSKLNSEKVNKLKKLIDIYDVVEPCEEDLEIKTLNDLYKETENSNSKWKLEGSIDWSVIPLGQCPNSSVLNAQDILEESSTCPEWLELEEVNVQEINWNFLLNNCSPNIV